MRAFGGAGCAVWVLSLGLGPAPVRAYSAPAIYASSERDGGGGGRWFTGSPAEGYGCEVCHSDAQGQRPYRMRVAGLPIGAGYDAATSYPVTITWPTFEAYWRVARPDPAVTPGVGLSPAVGMVAELVAEDGLASGTIEIVAAEYADPAALCEMRRPNSRPRLGVSLYQVRTGIAPLLIQPDKEGILRCESRQLAQRCLIALESCGAHRVDFQWTPPDTASGPIWFSAGFVASELISGTPTRDSVHEVSVPLVAADSQSGRYESTLASGSCSLAAAAGRRTPGWPLSVLGALVLALVRRRSAGLWVSLRAGLSALAGLAFALAGCVADARGVDESDYPAAGLFTPGSTLGASDPTDSPENDRCEPPGGEGGDTEVSGTEGTLAVTYTTATLMGQYAPENVSAVWIENADLEYVATINLVGRIRDEGLRRFKMRACQDPELVDVTASATRRTHEMIHDDIAWDARDFEGELVPDGDYRIYFEVTETDKADGYSVDYTFTKGPQPFSQDLPVDFGGGLASASIVWTPEPKEEASGEAQ